LIEDDSKYVILIKEHASPSKYGVVFVENNHVKKIIEKPREDIGKYISTGIYKLPPSIFKEIDELTSQGVFALSSVIQSIADRGVKIRTILADLWMDIVYPWDIINVNESIIKNKPASTAGILEKGVTLKGDVSIGKDTRVYAGSYIVGPTVIGEGCEIGPNVCIFPSTTVGNNVVIHPFTNIRNSVIMNDVHISSNSFISHSVIGKGCIIGHNFSTTPKKTNIEIEDEYKRLDTPIGVMIGEDCIIENNVVTGPGVIIGRKCRVNPLNTITQNIPSGSQVM